MFKQISDFSKQTVLAGASKQDYQTFSDKKKIRYSVYQSWALLKCIVILQR